MCKALTKTRSWRLKKTTQNRREIFYAKESRPEKII